MLLVVLCAAAYSLLWLGRQWHYLSDIRRARMCQCCVVVIVAKSRRITRFQIASLKLKSSSSINYKGRLTSGNFLPSPYQNKTGTLWDNPWYSSIFFILRKLDFFYRKKRVLLVNHCVEGVWFLPGCDTFIHRWVVYTRERGGQVRYCLAIRK